MTTTLGIHPRNDSGSFSLLHGVHGGNDKRGLNGWFACFSLPKNTGMRNDDTIFSFVFVFHSIATAFTKEFYPKEERLLRETGKTVVNWAWDGIMGGRRAWVFWLRFCFVFWSSFFTHNKTNVFTRLLERCISCSWLHS
jgi:hypothetical protein